MAEPLFTHPRVEAFGMESRLPRHELERRVDNAMGSGWTVQRLGDDPEEFVVLSERARRDPDGVVNLGMSEQEAWNFAHRLRSIRGIQWAEPFFGHRAPAVEEKASVATEAAADFGWSVRKSGVDRAWGVGGNFGEGIKIGHPDTGYHPHDELKQQSLVLTEDHDFVDGDQDARDPLIDGVLLHPGHGTGTASVIIGGSVPEGTVGSAGMTGIAPRARVVPIRTHTSVVLVFVQLNLAAAIRHAVDRGCDVISISMGGLFNWFLHKAVKRAQERGVIVVAAAGNHVGRVVWPAAYDEVVACAASNERDGTWSGSSRGEAVDITAPGERVFRANVKPGMRPPFNRVEPSSGTSYAAAITAGIAALWLAHHGGRAGLRQRLGIRDEAIGPLFRSIVVNEGFRTVAGWQTDRFGPGIIDAEKILRADPTRHLGRRVAAASGGTSPLVSRSEEIFQRFQPLLGDPSPFGLQQALSDTLDVPVSQLSSALRDVGDEVAFHAAFDAELNDSLTAAAARTVRFATAAEDAAPSRMAMAPARAAARGRLGELLSPAARAKLSVR